MTLTSHAVGLHSFKRAINFPTEAKSVETDSNGERREKKRDENFVFGLTLSLSLRTKERKTIATETEC